MVDGRGQPRLPNEALSKPLVLRQLGGEDLERRPPPQAQLLGEVDDAHASAADQPLDAVAGDLAPDPGVLAHAGVASTPGGFAAEGPAAFTERDRRTHRRTAALPCRGPGPPVCCGPGKGTRRRPSR